jgi:hypothetical protein
MLPSNSGSRGTPAYDLERIQQLVGQGDLSRVITRAAYEGAQDCDWGREEIVEAILSLSFRDFYKTMPAEKRAGFWQDVYHLAHRGEDLYIKLQIDPLGFAIVVQFKRR